MMLRSDLLLAALLGFALCALVYRLDRRRRLARRARLLDLVRPLLREPRVDLTPLGFPVLEGGYAGRRVKLELLLDQMALRKLPALWLLVTAYGETGSGGTLDLLLRPMGHETFSPSASLPRHLAPAPGWPAHLAARGDEDLALPLAALAGQADFLADPRAKELTVTPRGVRLVWLAHEGERAHYLVLRDAELGDFQVPAAAAEPLLNRAVGLLDGLAPARQAA
jgi:hypothetical protein